MYFEEYEVGKKYKLPDLLMTEDEIIKFAEKYDPRPIHVNEEEAKKSRFKGIIASGIHTLAATWAVWVKTEIDASGLIAGMQIYDAKWMKPVYPGDVLSGVVEIAEKKERSDGKTGEVLYRLDVKNQRGEHAFTFTVSALVAKEEREE